MKAFDLQADLFVYLLQGGQDAERSSIRRGIALLPGVETIDTENERDRQAFFGAIANPGTSGMKQLSSRSV
ncbi:MAG: hypothetical protein KA712_07660 [Myxococcales bacterium]|nr:hypothetical protein [Myxococcales bacterium]